MNIKEVAVLTGISVRALHHYNQIGLLSPKRNIENDYREYEESDIDRLQQILLFRACGIRLSDIKQILDNPDFEPLDALEFQKKVLLHQSAQLELLLQTVDKTISSIKGGKSMNNLNKFKGFDLNDNPYESEARERWGNDAVDRSSEEIRKMTIYEKQQSTEKMNLLFSSLAGMINMPAEDKAVQAEINDLYILLSCISGSNYNNESFAGLGRMYTEDNRFTKNIDKFGEGLSEFLAKAMAFYSETTLSDQESN